MAMAKQQAQAWGKKISSWADESEAAEAEAALATSATTTGGAAEAGTGTSEDAFPSLSQAAVAGGSSGGGSKKKSKGQTLSLAEFTTGKYVGPGAARRSSGTSGIFMSDSNRLTSEELMYLPTGPKERSAEELYEHSGGRLGGGFRGYGGGGGGGFRGDRDRDRDYSSDNMHHAHLHPSREPMQMPPPPSRADESADWFANKNVRPPSRGGGGGSEHRRFTGDRDAPSKADEVDDWTSGKRFVPSDRRSEADQRGYRSQMDENWGAGRRTMAGPPMRTDSDRWSFKDGASSEGDRWSESGMDAGGDRWSRNEPPRRPRLNLQPRTLPLDSSSTHSVSSRPSSSHSSRPGTPGEVQAQTESKSRVNPFGAAKPREMVLEERGQDWRKLDSELEHKRFETEEEKRLKEEIKALKDLIKDGENGEELNLQLEHKEQELEQIIKDLETKARLSDAPRRRDEVRRPPSSHDNRSRGAEIWRRPRTPSMHDNDPGWRRDRPRTPSMHENDYGYRRENGRDSRPRTPSVHEDEWKRPDVWRHENEYGRADMWSRPRTPSVHEDEWRRDEGRRSSSYQQQQQHHQQAPTNRW